MTLDASAPREQGRPTLAQTKGSASADALLYKADLTIRLLVGAIALGTLAVMLSAQLVLDGPVGVRGSISAYYHSGLRDLFVGALWAIGTLLVAYKAAEPRTGEFWASLCGGIGAIGLAIFPTGRPGLPHKTPNCADVSSLGLTCTWLQDKMGENRVESLHHLFTTVFAIGLAVVCVIFARTALVHSAKLVYLGCLVLMAAALVEFLVGALVGFRPKMYVAELVFGVAFAVAWFYKGRLLLLLIASTLSHTPAVPAAADPPAAPA